MVEITNKNYDENIIKEGEEHQIKNYYMPEALSERRRVIYVMQMLKVAPMMKTLDLGCGVGTFAFHMAKAGVDAYGIDYSEESIKMAEKLCEKFKVKPHFISADIVKGLPYDDNYFDRIACVDFIEHITDEDKVRVVKEMKRVLKPDGLAVIYTPNKIREDIGEFKGRIFGGFKENPLHFGLITRRNFEKILEGEGLIFKLKYYDVVRPSLAWLPFVRGALALNLLWKVQK